MIEKVKGENEYKKKFEQLIAVERNGQARLGGLYEYSKNQNKKSIWD